ncbi:Sodium/nucleoside cotransporter [Aphelenchoides besseyi]|nr:Sodium/nucleoside cotransporter [Aphelenchoides besseyi]
MERRDHQHNDVYQIDLAPETLGNGVEMVKQNGPTTINQRDQLKPSSYIPEELYEEPTGIMRHVERAQRAVGSVFELNAKFIRYTIYLLLIIGYHVFLGFASAHNYEKARPILVLTIIVWAWVVYRFVVVRFLGRMLQKTSQLLEGYLEIAWKTILFRIACYLILVGAIVVFLVFDTKDDRSRLMGLCGMTFYISLMFICSAHPSRINWRPVILGFLLQFIMALLVLRWQWGGERFTDATQLVIDFLSFTDNGTSFVYGFLAAPPNICGMSPVFAFSVIQVVVYFGAVVALLYYFGIMQAILKRMAWLMQLTLGTTATESLNSCACIFLGMSEAPLLIRPYLGRMTASELHAIMTNLLSATVMSAPGSLACSKILFPETERSQLKKVEDLELPEGNGAVAAVELVTAILANLIVFLALLAFLDSVIAYMGGLIGYPAWSFEAKSAMIATYALAGFSNFSSVGIQLGILGGMQPDRKPLLSRLALRALFAGCISCFMTASLAGVLVSVPTYCTRSTDTSNCFNITEYLNRNQNQSTTLLQAFDFFSNPNSTGGHLEL